VNGRIRTFIGIKLSDNLITIISDLQSEMKRINIIAKWVEPENFHISLKFLGNITFKQVEDLKRLLQEIVKNFHPFEIHYKGIGVFPEKGTPRVLWVGCGGDTEMLADLAKEVDKACKKIGVQEETREYTAHLTIARIKTPENIDKLKQKIKELQDRFFGKQIVNRITFFKSQLTPEGSIYTPLAEFTLE
jgi:2'-5' RNA ligase